MSADTENKPLADRLGIGPGQRIIIINPPPEYDTILGGVPEDTVHSDCLKKPLDFIHYFAPECTDLTTVFPRLKRCLAPEGMLWISWPKLSSDAATDLDENIVREIGLDNGLVDVKVCSIDDSWSGLKFVFRTIDRA